MAKPSVSDSVLIIGGIAIFVFWFIITMSDALQIETENEILNSIPWYILLIGLVLLGSGISYKIRKWRKD